MPAGLLLVLLLAFQADAPLERARQLVAEGKMREAEKLLGEMDQSLPAVAHLTGLVHYNLREYGKAIDALKRIADQDSGAVLLIGQSYYLSGRPSAAIPWLERVRPQSGARHEVAYMLGNAYLQSRQTEKAVGAFAEMFSVPSDSAAAYLIAAQMMVRQQMEREAERVAAQALQLDPKLPGAHLLLGELLIFRAQLAEGIAELRKEIALSPANATAYYKLGDAFTRQEMWDEAIPLLQKSVWLNPTHSGPYILLGKAYFKKHELTNAEGMLRRALQLDPQNYPAHYLLGQTLLQAGRPDEAKEMLKKSQELRSETNP
jgi:tetratricopeptide (TPR) repeat protein